MALDPTLPLMVQAPPQVSPLQTIGGLMQLRDSQSQIALRQAQTQQAQQQAQDTAAQAQQRNRDLADQNTIQQAMADPDINARVHTGDFSDLAGKIQPKTLFGLQQQQQAFIGTKLAQTKEQNQIQSEGMAKVLNGLLGLKSLVDANGNVDMDKVNQALPGLADQLRRTGALKDAGITAPIPTSFTDPKQIDQYIATAGGGKAAVDYALEQQGKQATTAASEATTRKTNVETDILEGQQQLYQTLRGNPQALAAHVANSIDPKKYPAEFQRAVNEASLQPDLRGINDAIAKHSALVGEQEKSIATETNPAVIQARVNQAAQTAQATAPIETAKAITTAKALRMGDNPAIAGVAPAAVGQVQNQAIKLDEEYVKAKAATDAMGSLLDLAQSGNKAAGSNVPLVGVETLNAINGIKRINSAEIGQYGSAGSLLDEVKGKIGKLAVGQPIPQDVLNDIRQLHQTLGQQSYQNYVDSLNALNSRSGSKYAPTIGAPNIRTGPVPPIKLKDGRTLTPHDQAAADAFRKDHPEMIQQ